MDRKTAGNKMAAGEERRGEMREEEGEWLQKGEGREK